MITRRGFLGGLLAAPAIIKIPGLLMPVKAFAPPRFDRWTYEWVRYPNDPIHVWLEASEDGSVVCSGLDQVVHRQIMEANLYGTSIMRCRPSDL